MKLLQLLASITFGRSQSHKKSLSLHSSRCSRIESLEERRLLAIDWVNQGTNNFGAIYDADDAVFAEAIVERAISDWDRVITDFNYDGDNDPLTDNIFDLTIDAAALSSATSRGGTFFAIVDPNGLPTETTIRMDDNGGGAGWFFDTTPLDDIEFTGIADAFQASFIDATTAGQADQNDFYRTIVHEIGHALGITSNPNAAIDGMLTSTGITDPTGLSTRVLETFASTRANPQFGVQATFLGGHLYEGSANDPGGLLAHPNELMNPGRTVPAGSNPAEAVRQFISDLDVMVLADAYGYAVALPSTLDSAHVMLDNITGTLLVQGLPGAVVDTIDITVVGANSDRVRVVVNGNAEEVPLADVTQILIAGNGGNDNVTVAPALAPLRQDIDYVVSSNEDAIEATGVGDGVVDLDAVVPGNQTTLRGAIRDANAANGADAIYVGRGNYDLTLTGTGGDDQRDLDITGDVTIIGAGAGLTVIDATAVNDRVFLVNTSGTTLDLSQVTLTGGNIDQGGAIWVGSGASLTLNESALVNNTASNRGGAIRLQGLGTVEIFGSIIADNTGSRGGGIYADNGKVVLGNSIVANNTATSAIAIQNGDENDIFGITGTAANPASFSYGNNLLTSVRSNLVSIFNEYGDTIDDPTDLFVVTTVADGIDPNDGGVSLREAFNLANEKINNIPINGTVWLPPWRHRLTLQGAGGDDFSGDVDLVATGNVEIVGVGAGLTVIDASGLGERIFDVRSGVLDISRVTLTGGDTTSGNNGFSGGAIWVRGGATLNLFDSAVVGNTSGGNGGGIFSQGTTTITNSVITGNSATGTGGLHVTGAAGITTTVGGTIIANNTSAGSMDDVYKSMNVTFTSSGNNLLTSDDSGVFNQTGDLIGTVDHVVTSVIDSYRHADDNFALSVREAVDLANQSSGLSEVWMPAWDFLLTRQRDYSLQLTDTDVSYGDIDISESIVLRGIAGETTIDWLSAIEIPDNNRDKIFDLLGSTADGTGDATAGGADFLTWQREYGGGVGNPIFEEFLSDFDDDGEVDGDDYGAVWQQYFGNTLDLEGISVLS